MRVCYTNMKIGGFLCRDRQCNRDLGMLLFLLANIAFFGVEILEVVELLASFIPL